ncbi:hypothetical protein AH04_143 [Erwinia phage AH04]|uniref:Virion structural protein n=1 Tax=Erwinia phage AH04 TaxID=2869569 RepID=A0AAE8BQX2_9CAUD|nr:virion structural protein [Erwinia phage AH04]QZA70620.1 hypothetical protein AH04_143 [Erwinia phage AH04]
MKDIQLIDIDYSGKNTEYKKEDTVDLSKISSPWIVPEEGPFYKDSLRVIKGGLDIDSDKFKAVSDVTDLTKLTGRGVCLYVELADDILASKGEVTVIYQKVGKPVISVKTLLQMLEDMVIDGKPVDWDTQVGNKPGSVWPALHSHDIQNPNELVGFGGLVELFTLFTNTQITDSGKAVEILEKVQTEMYTRLDYIQKLKWGAIMDHVRNYNNPHGVVPADVDADKLSNFFLATPQQDAEGLRSDLYSTPLGLDRLISETQPVTENFIVQAELPFGYYGSGIYLPPPITGSFEGLGGDSENSAFNLEGNGWLVCLFRAFDGRVKNLYYAYKTDFTDRDGTRTPWLDTYVQYQHPTIAAANKTANITIDGSDGNVLMLGDQPDPKGNITGNGNWWICAANSTFDPNSHTLKPVTIQPVLDRCMAVAGVTARPSCFKISKVGDWVYLFATLSSFTGDDSWPASNPSWRSDNWQTLMFRFPYKDLLDDTKTSISFTSVNVTYDTLWRERKTGKPNFIPQRVVFSDIANGLATEFVNKTSKPIDNQSYLNRKKSWIIVANPNNPAQARLKLMMSPFCSYTDPATKGQRAFQGNIVATYDWDVVNNVLTLSSNFSMPTLNMDSGGYVSPTQQQLDYAINDKLANFVIGYVDVNGSWIPGYGYMVMNSAQTGSPPYTFRANQFNRDGDISKDYASMVLPNTWTTDNGIPSVWAQQFKMRSPFGVAGFPRMFSDLYALTTGVRTVPIEVFRATNENQTEQMFYRITEGGTDDGYDKRDALQSDFISFPIYGRKTNSNFGTVQGLTADIGYANRPKRKNATSRQVGMFSWYRQGIDKNPGAAFNYSQTTTTGATVVTNSPQSDGSLVINLDLDYSLDTLAKVLTAKANPAKQVRIPRSVYVDMVMNALGVHANSLIDLCVDFFIGQVPGSGGDQVYSFWSATYHLTGSPASGRMIIGQFTWDVASTGADGIRVLKVVGLNYPFKSAGNYSPSPANNLTPGNDNNIVTTRFTIDANNRWSIIYDAQLQVRQRHVEILDFESEGNGNMEMVFFSGLQISVIGNAMNPRIIYNKRNNVVTRATAAWREGNAFNLEYSWQLFANAQWGWLAGVAAEFSGAAIDLTMPWNGNEDLYRPNDPGANVDKLIMYGATYVEGNWSLFINADIGVTFNGQNIIAKATNWDLRDLTDIYRSQEFYIYCVMDGSVAKYEVTKILRNHNATHFLVGIVTTDDFGIVTIERRQSFSIAGFPLTRTRDMGIPVSTGAITEQGTYKFLNRSELYDN